MRLSGTKLSSISQSGGLGNQLWDLSGTRPSLDLPFSDTKSLVDTTTGKTLVDFTRASSGTYVGSDGLIKTATTNLLLQSEDFSTTWSTTRSSILTNATTAPNGTITADKLHDDNATIGLGYVAQSFTSLGSANYTFSFYAKASEYTAVSFYFTDSSGITANTSSSFDLATGVASGASSALMQAIGDGWYRCSVVGQPLAGAATVRILLPADTAALNGIYLWGAQLEQSSTVGEYVPTTSTINSAPRFDHDPETGESLGLLVEESRTNLLLRSEEFDSASWITNKASAFGSGSIANAGLAPNGTVTADKLAEGTTNGYQTIYQPYSAASGIALTFSVYVKADERNVVVIRENIDNNYQDSIFDLVTGTVYSTAPNRTSSIQSVGNGWYRISLASTTTASTSVGLNIAPALSTAVIQYTGNGTSGIYLWGAQLEAGSFPTSYIPTAGTTVTRAADVADISGSNFSSWYRQDEGTVFASIYTAEALDTSQRQVYTFDDGTTSNRIRYHDRAGAGPQIRFEVGGVATSTSLSQWSQGDTKAAGAWAAGSGDFSTNANSAVINVPTPIPIVNAINLGQEGANHLNGHLKRLTYWPTRLPNETLQTITN